MLTSYSYLNILIDFVLMQVEVPDDGATVTSSSFQNGVVSHQLEYPAIDIGAPDLVSKQVKLSSVCLFSGFPYYSLSLFLYLYCNQCDL
jgi:hypothetical protein